MNNNSKTCRLCFSSSIVARSSRNLRPASKVCTQWSPASKNMAGSIIWKYPSLWCNNNSVSRSLGLLVETPWISQSHRM